MSRLLISLIVFVCGVFSMPSFAVVGGPGGGAVTVHPTELLVRFRDTGNVPDRGNAYNNAGVDERHRFRLVPGLTQVQTRPGRGRDAALQALRANPAVLYAEPVYIVHAQVTPNDPRFGELYGLHNTGQTNGVADADIDAPEAWDLQTGARVVVAVIDSGVDYNHQDLSQNIWSNAGEIAGNGIDDDKNGYIDDIRGWDFVNNDNNPMDDNRHGTHVAGTIAAQGNNGVGVVGVNWQAAIMPLKFLSSSGSGSTANAIKAVDYAAKMGARISNNSWGGGGFSQALSDAIARAGAAGHLFVAAAGNAGANNDASASYPANYALENIVSVAATDASDQRASFSNYGATTVDLGAPGVAIMSTTPSNGYQSLSGTSMAAPQVSGVAALLLASDPALTVAQLKDALFKGVDPIPALAGLTVTGGRLNAFNSVRGLKRITVTPADASMPVGGTQQFAASGGTSPYTWSLSNPDVGSIDSAGLFTARAAGTTNVTATDSAGTAGSASVTVVGMTVTPADAAIAIGASVQLTASNGTAPYRWSSSDSNVATVDSTGLVQGVAVGAVTITATDAANATATSRVTVQAITVTPQTGSVEQQQTLQFSASGGTAPYTWSVSDPALASISTSGLLTGLAIGSVVVSATDANGGRGSSGTITVTEATAHTIAVSPTTARVRINRSLQFSASGGPAPYTWSLSNPSVGTISATGVFRASRTGTTVVIATDADGHSGQSGTITVSRF